MIYYPLHEIFRYQKLPHAFQTMRIIVRSNSSLVQLRKTQNSQNFIDLTYSISLLSHNLLLINLRTREYCTFPISNLFCTPKLMQRHYKLSKIGNNEMSGMIFHSPVDSGRKNSEASIKFRKSCFAKSTL